MYILGVTQKDVFNQAACLLKDGKIIAFAEEERFSRIKQSRFLFPENAISYCLKSAGIKIQHISKVAIGWDKFIDVWNARLSKEHIENMSHFETVDYATGENGQILMQIKGAQVEYGLILNLLNFGFSIEQLSWHDHHHSHAAGAISCSGFDRCNYISFDGEGGGSTGRLGFFENGQMHQKSYFGTIGSIGLFYEGVTEYLGFKPHEQEGKTMGLACYGEVDESLFPKDIFFKNKAGITQVYDVALYEALDALSERGFQSKIRDNILCKEAVNLAKTTQYYFEKILIEIAEFLYSETGCKDFALSGGCMLNCSANGRLIKEPFVDNLFVIPCAHDSGTALGAAILEFSKINNNVIPKTEFNSAYWGSSFTKNEITQTLNDFVWKGEQIYYQEHGDGISQILADLISNDKVVGYFAGKSEVGPRALCHRSILANPTIKENLDRVNKIKQREFWRPLAPVIAEEDFHSVVDLKQLSPYMLIAAPVKEEWKSKIPAVTHVDGSCRPQSVNSQQNKVIHQALNYFKKSSGAPVFLNTSFNLKGEPLVDSPADAIKTFMKSDLDFLIMEDILVSKNA